MKTSSVTLYSTGYRETRTYLAAALFAAGNIVLPQLCHLVQLGGPTMLPIYFFTLVGAYKYGWRTGLLTALASPLVNAALFGMPAGPAFQPRVGGAARRRRAVLPDRRIGRGMGLDGQLHGRRAGFPDRDSRHVIAGVRRIPLYKVRNTQIAMMKKICMISFVLHFAAAGSGCASGNDKKAAEAAPAKVYMTRDISPAGMKAVYEALGRKAEGKKVAVKLSTGEPGGNNFLQPALIGDLVKSVKGTIVECNTAYGGGRAKTEDHLKAAADHGFTAIAPVDIMDAEGEVRLPVEGGRHLKYDIVGSHFPEYDFVVVLSHFKGHAMGGFGGAIKNISIGIASSAGKAWIHSAGKTEDTEKLWSSLPAQDDFLESMAEAAKAIAAHCGERILYISVMNNLSVDCDCDAHPEPPRMGDIGILASLDPVALDQACVDLVYASPDEGKVHLIERMESRHGIHTLEHAAAIGIGSRQYELVDLDK